MSSVAVSLYLSLTIVLLVLSHEGMLFYGPYFFAVLVLSGRPVRQALKECVVPVIVGLAAAWICSRHNGTVEIATQICSSLGYSFNPSGNSEVCSGGAITYLTRSAEYARADALGSIRQFHFLLVFPCFAALALLPAVAESVVLARTRFSREVLVLWTTVAISFLCTLILFYYAYDWNRWVYIHVASITILLLLLDGKGQRDGSPIAEPGRTMTMQQQAGCGAILVLYALLCIAPNAILSLSFVFMKHWNHQHPVAARAISLQSYTWHSEENAVILPRSLRSGSA